MKRTAKEILNNKSGYISIETAIIGGLIMGLGTIAITDYMHSSTELRNNATGEINAIQNGFRALVTGN